MKVKKHWLRPQSIEDWSTFKDEIKMLRKVSMRLNPIVGYHVSCTFRYWIYWFIFVNVDPFNVNLKTGDYLGIDEGSNPKKNIKINFKTGEVDYIKE